MTYNFPLNVLLILIFLSTDELNCYVLNLAIILTQSQDNKCNDPFDRQGYCYSAQRDKKIGQFSMFWTQKKDTTFCFCPI